MNTAVFRDPAYQMEQFQRVIMVSLKTMKSVGHCRRFGN